MIIHNAPQGSPEWKRSRAGVVTASMVSVAREKLKSGLPTSAAKAYAARLALERIGGSPLDEGMETPAMRRGRELEPIARAKLAKMLRVDIEIPGFITTDDKTLGASADGFIGADSGCEIKCLVDPSRIAKAVIDSDLSEFMDQMQCCMYVTGRTSWHYALYLPQLAEANRELYHKCVPRDEAFIADMLKDLQEFEKLVTITMKALKSAIPVYDAGF